MQLEGIDPFVSGGFLFLGGVAAAIIPQMLSRDSFWARVVLIICISFFFLIVGYFIWNLRGIHSAVSEELNPPSSFDLCVRDSNCSIYVPFATQLKNKELTLTDGIASFSVSLCNSINTEIGSTVFRLPVSAYVSTTGLDSSVRRCLQSNTKQCTGTIVLKASVSYSLRSCEMIDGPVHGARIFVVEISD